MQQLPVRARRSEPERAEQVAVQMRHVQRLVRHCRDRGIRGDPAAAARGGGILAATEPARWQWKAGLRRFQLDSSQLLEILLLSGRVGPAAAELVCRALGLWKDAGTAWDGMTQTMFTRPITREDSLELRELKQYFLALMFACSLDTTLQVRVTTGRRGAAAAAPGPAAHRERPQAWLSADERRTAALR
ncbi:MAG: hypothetical protein FJX77_16265 [Armatimonadetes bacterium]|nr:hypothetical protein [Armatimonadota bacterium]